MKKEKIIRYVSTILCGLLNALEGAMAVFMVISSIVLFVDVANDYGYLAILDFVFAILALCVAFVIIRAMGKRIMHQYGNFCEEVRK